MTRTVLIVCHANTARSVIAHTLLERRLAARGAGDRVRVRSGGIAHWARDGMIASHDARLVLREMGVVLAETDFVSTSLRRHPHLVADADLILTMTAEQKTLLAGLAESDGRPIFTLREFVGEWGDIGDPAGQDEDVFRACRDEIARCLDRIVDRLVEA